MTLPESAVGMSVASKANIDAWFERIGFAGSIAPSLETLNQLHQLHPAAIPYENLDPLMGAPVRLDLANLQQKLLFDRRGGYCFEHNLLFKAMLEELDFEVKMHGARVLWGLAEGEEPPLRHLVLTVEVAGVTYLADVGFGGQTATAPLRLRADVPQATPLDTFRLLEADGTWQVDMEIEGECGVLAVLYPEPPGRPGREDPPRRAVQPQAEHPHHRRTQRGAVDRFGRRAARVAGRHLRPATAQ